MSIIKTEREINIARESGRRLAAVLYKVILKVVPGVTPKEIDAYAEKLIREGGDEPVFLGYKPSGAKTPYPATMCISVNNEVVHGIPKNTAFKKGDIVSLDIGLKHKGFITDMARTVPVGSIDKKAQKLISTTEEALARGIVAARVGAHIGDIGHAIEAHIKKNKFSIVEELGGHGVGQKIHEEPHIPNYGKKGAGAEIIEGMVLALEPIVNEGSRYVVLHSDGYTFKTKDGKRSAHFEDTILITKNRPEVLTKNLP
ncbi:MAG: type I methionyl aminopeptidase [Parcubacteria group bacterium]|nr:type I methionyl aminopeptidase [Parcubacteria group bacterium]